VDGEEHQGENNGKTGSQKGSNMNTINNEKSCLRRERPETYLKIFIWALALISFIPYLIIVLALKLGRSFLRMSNIIAGKIREKL